jgi:hypothetical protein
LILTILGQNNGVHPAGGVGAGDGLPQGGHVSTGAAQVEVIGLGKAIRLQEQQAQEQAQGQGGPAE